MLCYVVGVGVVCWLGVGGFRMLYWLRELNQLAMWVWYYCFEQYQVGFG